MTDREISQAFDKLVKNEDILAKYRFFFLNDGLDEFEGARDISQHSLAMKLKAWT